MRRRYWIILGLALAVAAGAFLALASMTLFAPKDLETTALRPTAQPQAETSARIADMSTPPAATAAPAEEPETAEPYVSPVDFAALRAINPDVFSWLVIPDTEINYPVLRDPENDRFYMNHDSDRNFNGNGALFVEASYNGETLTDPVTVVYGHHMLSGLMFGYLERYYSDSEYFDSHPTFTVYTPTAALVYEVFAAVPWSREHLLLERDFTDARTFEDFFLTVFAVRDLRARFREESAPEAGYRVMILSTCLSSNNTQRFLVMGKLLNGDLPPYESQ